MNHQNSEIFNLTTGDIIFSTKDPIIKEKSNTFVIKPQEKQTFIFTKNECELNVISFNGIRNKKSFKIPITSFLIFLQDINTKNLILQDGVTHTNIEALNSQHNQDCLNNEGLSNININNNKNLNNYYRYNNIKFSDKSPININACLITNNQNEQTIINTPKLYGNCNNNFNPNITYVKPIADTFSQNNLKLDREIFYDKNDNIFNENNIYPHVIKNPSKPLFQVTKIHFNMAQAEPNYNLQKPNLNMKTNNNINNPHIYNLIANDNGQGINNFNYNNLCTEKITCDNPKQEKILIKNPLKMSCDAKNSYQNVNPNENIINKLTNPYINNVNSCYNANPKINDKVVNEDINIGGCNIIPYRKYQPANIIVNNQIPNTNNNSNFNIVPSNINSNTLRENPNFKPFQYDIETTIKIIRNENINNNVNDYKNIYGLASNINNNQINYDMNEIANANLYGPAYENAEAYFQDKTYSKILNLNTHLNLLSNKENIIQKIPVYMNKNTEFTNENYKRVDENATSSDFSNSKTNVNTAINFFTDKIPITMTNAITAESASNTEYSNLPKVLYSDIKIIPVSNPKMENKNFIVLNNNLGIGLNSVTSGNLSTKENLLNRANFEAIQQVNIIEKLEIPAKESIFPDSLSKDNEALYFDINKTLNFSLQNSQDVEIIKNSQNIEKEKHEVLIKNNNIPNLKDKIKNYNEEKFNRELKNYPKEVSKVYSSEGNSDAKIDLDNILSKIAANKITTLVNEVQLIEDSKAEIGERRNSQQLHIDISIPEGSYQTPREEEPAQAPKNVQKGEEDEKKEEGENEIDEMISVSNLEGFFIKKIERKNKNAAEEAIKINPYIIQFSAENVVYNFKLSVFNLLHRNLIKDEEIRKELPEKDQIKIINQAEFEIYMRFSSRKINSKENWLKIEAQKIAIFKKKKNNIYKIQINNKIDKTSGAIYLVKTGLTYIFKNSKLSYLDGSFVASISCNFESLFKRKFGVFYEKEDSYAVLEAEPISKREIIIFNQSMKIFIIKNGETRLNQSGEDYIELEPLTYLRFNNPKGRYIFTFYNRDNTSFYFNNASKYQLTTGFSYEISQKDSACLIELNTKIRMQKLLTSQIINLENDELNYNSWESKSINDKASLNRSEHHVFGISKITKNYIANETNNVFNEKQLEKQKTLYNWNLIKNYVNIPHYKSTKKKQNIKDFISLLLDNIEIQNDDNREIYIRIKANKIGSEEFKHLKPKDKFIWCRLEGSYIMDVINSEMKAKNYTVNTGSLYMYRNNNLVVVSRNPYKNYNKKTQEKDKKNSNKNLWEIQNVKPNHRCGENEIIYFDEIDNLLKTNIFSYEEIQYNGNNEDNVYQDPFLDHNLDAEYFNAIKPEKNLIDFCNPFIDENFPPEKWSLISVDKCSKKQIKPHNFHTKNQAIPNQIKKNIEQLIFLRPGDVVNSEYQLFPNGKFSSENLTSGFLGYNYILIVLAYLSHRPDLIRASFKTKTVNPDGLYELYYYENGQKYIMFIDDFLPVDTNNQFLFKKAMPEQLWILLLHKAYAKYEGGFMNIIGGTMEKELQWLTGCLSTIIKTNQDTAWLEILNACSGNYFIVTSSLNNFKKLGIKDSFELNDCISFNILFAKEYQSEEKSIKLIKLRTPYEKIEWKGDYSRDSPLWSIQLKQFFGFNNDIYDYGCFFITFEDFCQLFFDFTICYIHNSTKLDS